MKKQLKNFVLCILLVCLLCSISACTPPSYRYLKTEERLVSSIQLIKYDNPNVEEQKSNFFGVAQYPFETFDESKCNVIEELSSEYLEDFETDLSELVMSVSDPAFRGPNGQGIRITYTDGTYYIATWYITDGWNGYGADVAFYNTDGTIVENSSHAIEAFPYMVVAANYFQTKMQ